MAKNKGPNIGATLTIRDGGFFTSMKSARKEADKLKGSLGGATEGTSGLSNVLGKVGGIAGTAVKGIAAVTGAVIGVTAAVGGLALAVGQDYSTASNSLAAQTGAAGDELRELTDSMENVYAANYGESFEDVADAMAAVKQQAKDMDVSGIEEMTEDALTLRDIFEFEVGESVRAADMLIEQFGVTGSEAYNLIAQGAQQGLDKNGDLLDTINEYSVHFAQVGLDAEDMFNMLENGAESGTFSVDKLGDAVKEFGIKAKAGDADEAFAALGISADNAKQAFAEGGPAAQNMFTAVNKALFGVSDKVQQNLIGVELYGTMWEDLGAEGVKALSDINGEFDRTADTLEQIKDIRYDDLGSAFEGLKRTLTTDLILPISKEITPAVGDLVKTLQTELPEDAFESISAGIGTGIAGVISDIAKFIPPAIEAVMDFFEAIAPAADRLMDAIGGIGSEITEAVSPEAAAGFGGEFTGAVSDIIDGAAEIVGAVSPLIGSLTGFIVENGGTILSVIGPVTELLGTAAELASTILGPLLDIAFAALGPALEVVGSAVGSVAGSLDDLLSRLQPLFDFWNENLSLVMPYIEGAFGAMGVFVSTALENVIGIMSVFLDIITGDWSGAWDGIKGLFKNTWEGIVDIGSTLFGTLRDNIGETFENIKERIGDIWDKITDFFTLPEIKQTGTKKILGIDIPTFDIEWNAAGGIMTQPTVFGMADGAFQGGGEAGAEAILPLDLLWTELERFADRIIGGGRGQTTNNNEINIYINAEGKTMDEIAHELLQKIKLALSNM